MEYLGYATTKEEWWDIVEKHWDDIKSLIINFYPSKYTENTTYPISAPEAEKACESIRKEIMKKDDYTQVISNLDVMKEAKDIKLFNILNDVWFGLPESETVRTLLGFQILCDLCSEGYVLYEDCMAVGLDNI